MNHRLLQVVVFCLLLPFVVSCSPFASKKPPVILIMVESFSEKDFLCSDPRLLDGLDSLEESCSQFLRFTHSFSPSILTQTAVATLLSGQSFKNHGVKTNGAEAIQAKHETLAEKAIHSGMRTAFFSGGVPLLPKFGIRQGIEYYNDSFSSKNHPNRRSFDESIRKGLRWVDEEVRESSFFMTFYVPDLLYRYSVTKDNFGDERPLLRHSHLEEFNESVDYLINELKRRRKWDNTHVILVGLKGESITTLPEEPLSSQFLHIPLQIKLATKTKTNLPDLVRELVSFEQLSEWISQLTLHKPSQGRLGFKSVSSESFVPQVSYWHSWLDLANEDYLGLRKKRYFFQLTPKLKIYDSFKDKDESEPIPEGLEVSYLKESELFKSIEHYFPNYCFSFPEANKFLLKQNEKCDLRWSNKKKMKGLANIIGWSKQVKAQTSGLLDIGELVTQSIHRKNKVVSGWLAYKSLYQKKWSSLFELGKSSKVKSWMLVAQMNLRESSNKGQKGCLRYFTEEDQNLDNFYRHCQDTELRRVIEGIAKLKLKQRPTQHFWNQVFNIRRRRIAMDINIDLQFMNDIDQNFAFQPSLAELYFFIPGHDLYRKLVEVDKT